MSCLIITNKIKEIASKIPGETPHSIANLIGIWQEQNDRGLDEYPSIKEIQSLIKELRVPIVGTSNIDTINNDLSISYTDLLFGVDSFNQDNQSQQKNESLYNSSIKAQEKINLIFDPQKRRDRVSLISVLFSKEVDAIIEEEKEKIIARINAGQKDPALLQLDLNSLTRKKAINIGTPQGIFNRIKNIFLNYINDTEENRIQAELDYISMEYSEEERLEKAKEMAKYVYEEYSKIVNDDEVFQALCEEATSMINHREGTKLNYKSLKIDYNKDFSEDDPEGNNTFEDPNDPSSFEEAVKDGWMMKARETSAHESLSQKVRQNISIIPRLNYKKEPDVDDLGFPRYLDSNYVHATLIDKLKNMLNPNDMIPMLQELSKNKPWVQQIIDLLNKDEVLFSQFYQDFRKDFLNYWIVTREVKPNGNYKTKTVPVNKPEGVYYLLDSWRDNYQSGILLDNDSIYNKNNGINKVNAAKGKKWTTALLNMLSNKSTEEKLNILKQENVFKTLLKLLRMIGIDADPALLENALTNIKKEEGINFTDPIMLLLPKLNIIFNGITEKEDIKEGYDLINDYSGAYNTIAKMLNEVAEEAIESSINRGGKNYYAHVNPSYLGKTIKNLKAVHGNMQRFYDYMEEQFGKYEWFKKKGEYRADWVKQIFEDKEAREGLDHKVVLDFYGNTYTKVNSLDYAIAMFHEYLNIDNNKSNTQWGWYHVPILGDASSAEFIKFKKYVDGSEFDEITSEPLTYKEILLNKFVDLVNQEYDRIMLVRERAVKRSNEDTKNEIQPIAVYDSTRGEEFCFLPALNNYTINGKLFINVLSEYLATKSGTETKEFIKNTLLDIIDNEFEETFVNWYELGMFEETPNGYYKYFSTNKINKGQSSQNKDTYNAFTKAEKLLGNLWTSEMGEVENKFLHGYPVSDKIANKVFDEINIILTQKKDSNEITLKEFNNIKNDLILRNPAKEALREYFWNSKFATSQIIQITTTDLAFYKNMEDFQKRFKEIYTSSLKLNTLATWKGERVGKDYERTIYLADSEITSTVYDEIKEVLNEKVKEGELSNLDRDMILSKYTQVNVADSQAYRSLPSYRGILIMAGQWTDEMENAYNNIINNTWNIADFNILWQTKKPFVYTQIPKIVGQNEDGTPIYQKVPVQHKNSEFLLMASYALIANSLGKSSKLKAINDFMLENNIDVIQFESTTKVGKQGKINLEGIENYESVLSKLKSSCRPNGIDNPNVIHTIPTEDYGIITATPEHIIDKTQLIGTQIRKLITADISDDVAIMSDGILEMLKNMPKNIIIPVVNKSVEQILEKKGFTKQEWLTFYNAINTENIIESFKGVNKIFKDPKNIEKILLEELNNNPRYGTDLKKACTLDENGHFNIPLFDPVQSQRVQTLLNSIIKSRITKQKIRGGSLIQVSDYGLTNQLGIKFKDSNGNIIDKEIWFKNHKNATEKDFNDFKNKAIKEGKWAIAYLECYMPAYSESFYAPFLKPGTHELDIDKVPENLKRLIGYRVPTEDKYSMIPLRIKGFLPQQNGSAIMLPAEITTLSGSDFDKYQC